MVAVVLVAGGVGAWRLLSSGDDKGGALVVSPDPIEFPTTRWGERAQRSFTVTNRSKRTVLVKDPRFSCGCFRLERPMPFSQMRPGDSATLDLILDSAQSGSPGRLHKEMTIESDDPAMPKLVVPIVGHLTAYRTVEPRSVTFGTVDPAGDVVERKVAVRADQGFTVSVLAAEADDKKRVAVESKAVDGGADVFIRSVKGAPVGPIGAQVRLTLRVEEKDREPVTVAESVWVSGRVQ